MIRYTASDFDRVLSRGAEGAPSPIVARIRAIADQLQNSDAAAGWDTYPPSNDHPKRRHPKHGHHNHNHHHHHHHHNNKFPTKPPSSRNISPEVRAMRELVANLNKLNASNFAKVSLHIHRSVSFDTDRCIPVLLDRCHRQCEYLPQFMQLFQSIGKDALQTPLDHFVSSFMEERSYLGVGKIEADYSAYCDWHRRKATTIRKHRAILAMMANGLTEASDLHSYFGSLLEAMYQWFDEDDTEDEVLELVLDMMAEFFRIENAEARRHVKTWRGAVQDALCDPDITEGISIKCRFKMMNIVEGR
jgi:hypothetical protein